MSSGEVGDIRIQLKDWNRTSSAKPLGTTVIAADALNRLLAGDNPKAAFPSDVFLITALDGKPLMGKDYHQTHLVLKVAVVRGSALKRGAELPGAFNDNFSSLPPHTVSPLPSEASRILNVSTYLPHLLGSTPFSPISPFGILSPRGVHAATDVLSPRSNGLFFSPRNKGTG